MYADQFSEIIFVNIEFKYCENVAVGLIDADGLEYFKLDKRSVSSHFEN